MGKPKGKEGRMLFGTVLLLSALFLLAACQDKSAIEKSAEKAIKDATGNEASVDIQGEKIRIQTKDGTGEINVTNTWPEDMPGDVPRFTLGKIKGVNKSQIEGKKNWNVVIDETQEGAFPSYVEELKGKGWKIDMNMSMGKGGSVAASKNQFNLVVVFNNDQKSGSITVSQNQ